MQLKEKPEEEVKGGAAQPETQLDQPVDSRRLIEQRNNKQQLIQEHENQKVGQFNIKANKMARKDDFLLDSGDQRELGDDFF